MKLLDSTNARFCAPNGTAYRLYTVCSNDYKYMRNFTDITDTMNAFDRAHPATYPTKLAELPHLAENFNTIEELQQLIPEYFI